MTKPAKRLAYSVGIQVCGYYNTAVRILAVEDEHKIAGSIKRGLEQERYAVDVAYTGTDGYDLACVESYDLIILDLMLPGMDGLTLCKKLRHQGNHTPILILTAKDLTETKVEGLDLGADDYLTKPFSFEELLARIRALLRRPSQTLQPVLRVGDLVMNSGDYKVARNNVPIMLSAKEFALLDYLMRNAGKILNKDTIIAHVWDYDADILPNTVEVYIKNLRLKIDAPFKNEPPLIHTMRGFGYMLGEKP